MKIRVILALLLLIAVPVHCAEYIYTAVKDEWLFIPVSLPEAKIGGGDFYNLQVEIVPDDNSVEYSRVTGGVRFRSESTGTFNVLLGINHITKSSCASVESKQILDDKIQVNVVK